MKYFMLMGMLAICLWGHGGKAFAEMLDAKEGNAYPYSANPGVNLALHKKVETTDAYNVEKYPASTITDGNLKSYWVSAETEGVKQVTLDLGKKCFLDRWVVYHTGALGEDTAQEFKLQKSEDGKDWIDVDEAASNKENVTDKSTVKFCSRYIRIEITINSSQSMHGVRIAEIQLYNDKEARYPKKNEDLCLDKDAYEAMKDSLKEEKFTWKGIWKRALNGAGSIQIDLGKRYYFDHWNIQMEGNPTKSYRLWAGDDKKSWSLIYEAKNNTQSDESIEPLAARYIKLEILQEQSNSTEAEIKALRVYSSSGYIPQAGDICVRPMGTTGGLITGHSAVIYVDEKKQKAIEATYKALEYTKILNISIPKKMKFAVMEDLLWEEAGYAKGNYKVLRVRNADEARCIKVQKYALGKVGCGYNFNVFYPGDTLQYYCSSLVWDAWKQAGVDVGNGRRWFGIVTPNDLIDDEDTYCVYED